MNTTKKVDLTTTIGFHESGAMLQIYVLPDGEAYVTLLKSAPIRAGNGEWWGVHTLTAGNVKQRIQVGFHDLPGGNTLHFDKEEFRKMFFPRKGAGKDPSTVTTKLYPCAEHGFEATIRETKEEAHDVIQPNVHKTWTVEGGYTNNGTGLKSQTVVVLSIEKVSSVDVLLQMQATFKERNNMVFKFYNKWAKDNPLTALNEKEHWIRRPEFIDMTFVTWGTFCNGMIIADNQLQRYRMDRKNNAKGSAYWMINHMRRHETVVLRSWVVMILKTIMFDVGTVIDQELKRIN
jgi:hypothetical protein